MTVHSSKGLEFPYVFVSGMEDNLFPSGGVYSTPVEIEEERRLFYVALTRAKKAVTLTFSRTRMSKGKRESGSPSRFIGEIDRQYIANPLDNDDFNDSGVGDGFHFGSANPHSDGHFNGRFGMGDRPGARTAGSSAPVSGRASVHTPYGSAVTSAEAKAMLANRHLPPKVSDSEFLPLPMDQFKAGQRIEHNRFGTGEILEITGRMPDMKAKVLFDDFGEKFLLLKYAKMRLAK
jgi:DNA helicase-2/ATP-dependent DNA helicase PcrA